MRFLSNSLLLAIWLCSSVATSRHIAIDHRLTNSGRKEPHEQGTQVADARSLALRAGKRRAVCSAPTHSRANGKRALDYRNYASTNSSLWRRVMSLPESGQEEAFIMKETRDDGTQHVVWPVTEAGGETDVNTAVSRDFKKEMSLAATHLKGCTALVVASRKGVYFGHYWENISFDPDYRDPEETDDELFDRTVLRPLRDGQNEKPGRPLQSPLTKWARDFADDSVKAFLIIPSNNADENEVGYREQWNKMRATIESIIPKIGSDQSRWEEVKYVPKESEDELEETTAGRVLFKFDPEHVAPPKRNKPSRALAKIWVENREVYSDEWDFGGK